MNINNQIFPVVFNPDHLSSDVVTQNFCAYFKDFLGFKGKDEATLATECVQPIVVYIDHLKNTAIAARK